MFENSLRQSTSASNPPIKTYSKEQIENFIENDQLDYFKKAYEQTPVTFQNMIFYENKYSVLHLSAHYNKIRIIRFLMDKSFKKEPLTVNNETPLHVAAANESAEALTMLLDYELDINAREGINNMTPLLTALVNKNSRCVDVLIRASADCSLCDKFNNTPLLLAIDHQLPEVIQMLLRKNICFESANTEGISPIHMAVKRSDINTLNSLLQKGANIYVTNKNKETILDIAIKEIAYDIVHLILSFGFLIEPNHVKLAKERGSGGLWHEVLTLFKAQEEKKENVVELKTGEQIISSIEHQTQKTDLLFDFNELTTRYEQLRSTSTTLLSYTKKLEEEIESYKRINEEIKKQATEKQNKLSGEICVLKKKNSEVMNEMNLIRRKKLTNEGRVSFGGGKTDKEEKGVVIGPNPNMIINSQNVDLLNIIGEGSSGIVYQALYKGTPVAVKKLVLSGERPQQALKEMLNEMKVYELVRHPNIVQLLGYVIEKPHSLCIVTEYMPLRSLKGILAQKIPLSFSQFLTISIQICQAMIYLHSCAAPIYHRDLKSANVLLDKFYSAKICDFGIAKVIENQINQTRTIGTYQWMAPETLELGIYTDKSDVYSFGVILWELYTHKVPFDKLQPIQVIFAVIHENKRPLIPPNCPKEYSNLMKECWNRKQEDRPIFTQILQRLIAIRKLEEEIP